MENTAYDEDYGNYSYDEYTLTTPCPRDNDNNLGAKLSILYYFMFIISLCGNGLVLVIIHRFERLTTVTNILLLNLVFSSFIFMSSLPFLAVQKQLSQWIFGKVMCKIVGSVYYLGFYSSVLFLTILTIDRHIAVVYSLGASRLRSRNYVAISCIVVWIISTLACIGPMIAHTTFMHQDTIYCDKYPGSLPNINDHHLRTSVFYIQLFLFLIFPLVVIIYCYVRIAITVLTSRIVTKFKSVRLIFIIVLLFFFSWTPFNIVLLLGEKDDCVGSQRRGYALQVTRNITYIYFCFSPIFYTFVGRKFQNYFRQMLVKRFPALKQYISVSYDSRTNLSTKYSPNDH